MFIQVPLHAVPPHGFFQITQLPRGFCPVPPVFLARQLEVLRVSDKIQSQIKEEIDKSQREYYLRQQLRAIKEQLGEVDGDGSDLDEIADQIETLDLPDDVQEQARKQLKRLRMMQPASSEYGVTRTYLDALLDIPWRVTTEDTLGVKHARKILDEDHYGLEKVKKRIVEYLAVRKLKDDMKGPILCMVGPPGVGKTSLGQSRVRNGSSMSSASSTSPVI